ncbi:MnhB domain-containing protein [Suttonella ornithocola]|uniref:Multiple resistance and pH homeostasis protein B n=1 Tax=Suttonella ornithocola TaxID=279832 RepID=A0A380MPI3_9GAMM|nr:MnhB domain-containing protein [Suttonella ornithocola]SUO94505.1 Multiple resistance and pH homeostasis protein B [Suttonella ornithocola]
MKKTEQTIVLIRTAAKPLYWLLLGVSIVVFMRGHNAPGGGFIGGLLVSSTTLLWALVFSPDEAEARLPLKNSLKLAAVGVICAGVAGLPALILGKTFLTHYWLTIPIIDYPVSTVLLFDLGVYLGVWGVVSGYALALIRISHDGEQE